MIAIRVLCYAMLCCFEVIAHTQCTIAQDESVTLMLLFFYARNMTPVT